MREPIAGGVLWKQRLGFRCKPTRALNWERQEEEAGLAEEKVQWPGRPNETLTIMGGGSVVTTARSPHLVYEGWTIKPLRTSRWRRVALGGV